MYLVCIGMYWISVSPLHDSAREGRRCALAQNEKTQEDCAPSWLRPCPRQDYPHLECSESQQNYWSWEREREREEEVKLAKGAALASRTHHSLNIYENNWSLEVRSSNRAGTGLAIRWEWKTLAVLFWGFNVVHHQTTSECALMTCA